MRKILFMLIGMFSLQIASATEYFVRPDGGTLEQCLGTTDTAYNKDNPDQNCAVQHIFELLDPENQISNINGGDIITIKNNLDGSQAEYELGRHGKYIAKKCFETQNYDCSMPSIPAGTLENPTIIRGETWDNNCSSPPQLWGSGRAKYLFTLENTSNINIQCLNITDHSSCIGASQFPNQALICDREKPYDKPFADIGIYIADSENINLTDVTIEGLSSGIKAGRVGNITLLRTKLHANYSAGWNGDIAKDNSSNHGTITFKDSAITFSGCGIIYNPEDPLHGTPHACARQDIKGYGDGIGTANTGGDWIFDNTQVMHNSSDGIDLLYHVNGGKITIKNSRIEGNAGNAVKASGNTEIINNLIIGNCAWNSRQVDDIGKEGEICRAGGNAISIHYTHPDTEIYIINNTVYSEGDILLETGNRTGQTDGNQALYIVNNVFYALIDYGKGTENSAMYYTKEPFPHLQIHNNLIHMPKNFNAPCTNFPSNIPNDGVAGPCTNSGGSAYFDNDDFTVISNPHLPEINLGTRYTAFDSASLEREANHPYPLDNTSPVINAGYTNVVGGVSIPTTDYYGKARVGAPDIGAIEYISRPTPPTIQNIQEM